MEKLTERFLVTGAAGCIGAWAIRLLLDQGVDVVASDVSEDLRRFRLISHPRSDGVTFVPLDVTATSEVARVIQEHDITHVVHLAGLQVPFCAANPPLGAMVNVVGNVNVFDAIRVAERRIGGGVRCRFSVFGRRRRRRVAPFARYALWRVQSCERGHGSGLLDDQRHRIYWAATFHCLRTRSRSGHDVGRDQSHLGRGAGRTF
jgi:NAD(P)-dependent dehydrogenase (short-subunit alcohol dehydrogenase family)